MRVEVVKRTCTNHVNKGGGGLDQICTLLILYLLGAIHKLCRQDFGNFWPPSPLRRQVYYISLCSSIDIWQTPSPLACLRSLCVAPYQLFRRGGQICSNVVCAQPQRAKALYLLDQIFFIMRKKLSGRFQKVCFFAKIAIKSPKSSNKVKLTIPNMYPFFRTS